MRNGKILVQPLKNIYNLLVIMKETKKQIKDLTKSDMFLLGFAIGIFVEAAIACCIILIYCLYSQRVGLVWSRYRNCDKVRQMNRP